MFQYNCISFCSEKVEFIGMLVSENNTAFIKFSQRGEVHLNFTILPHGVPCNNKRVGRQTKGFILTIQVGKGLHHANPA